MKPFTACLSVALFSSAFAAPSAVEVSEYEAFKALHGKQHGPSQDAVRMKQFIQKSAQIKAHNARYEAGLESFSLKLNQYSDLSDEEFSNVALGYTPSNYSVPEPHTLEVSPSLPASIDFRQQNIMTPVRDQGGCGSCYAFAAGGVLESYILRTTGNSYDLSEQDVVDCSYLRFMGGSANGGCRGGQPAAVFDYYNQKDIVLENSYQYVSGQTGTHYQCRAPNPIYNFVRNKLRHRHIQVARESDLKQYLAQYGPFVLGMAADNQYKDMFRDLGNGIFDARYNGTPQPNHVVILAGYGNERGKDYWLIKNSWGTQWGVGGYGKIIMGKNMANIMTSGIWVLA